MVPLFKGRPVFKAVRVTGNKPITACEALLDGLPQRRVRHSLPQLAHIFLADLAENAVGLEVVLSRRGHGLELEIEVEFVLGFDVVVKVGDVGAGDVVVGFAVVGAMPERLVRDVRIEAGILIDLVFDEAFLNRVEFAAVPGFVESCEGYVDNLDGSLFEIGSEFTNADNFPAEYRDWETG